VNITLVHAPFGHHAFSENLRVVDEDFIVPPPIILAYVAAIAERAGHKVDLIDAHATRMGMDEAADRIKASGAEAIGFRVDVYNFHRTLEWIRHLKKATGLPVFAGGIGMTEYPVECMSHPEVDYGFVGEAVRSLPRFLDVLGRGGDPGGVPGLVWRDGRGLVRNEPEATFADFDEYPFPARHLLPNELYGSFVSKRRNFTIMLTSTGCPYRCAFCEIAPLHYRARSPAGIAREVAECCRDFGVREIDFFDATFFINLDRSLEICDRIASLKCDLEWTCRSRVDVVNDDILRAAKRAGLRMINFGIESASTDVLKNVKKDITPSQVRVAIEMCKRHGIMTLGFFMIGNPGETRETVEETIRYMRSLDLDFVQVCRTIAKPASELNRALVAQTGRDYWAEFIRGDVPEQRLPTPWTDLSQEEVESYMKKAYYGFYFRPRTVLHTALGVRSYGEFARYARVGLRMLFKNTSDIQQA